MTDTKVATQQARAAGAKTPADRKKAASATVKALQAEAAEGDRVIELRGEPITVHLKAFQDRLADDYEFMEQVTQGMIPAILVELVGNDGHQQLKDLARDKTTQKVSTESMAELFQEVMEATNLGN
ncbi:hypothetical protein GCM10009592_28710 [Brachybacterium rhamnosum]|uniref:Tail assembly chaperone n=1 Tax=Brachybacterium rhamnosum TaxID=173361 RepID=A0ABW4Q0X8_9MICO